MNVGDFADDFVRRAQAGQHPTIRVPSAYAAAFLMAIEPSFRLAADCLERISDPELRRIIEAIFYSTAAGAVVGLTIGGICAGPAGAKVGAAVGGAAGMVIGCVGVMVLSARQERGPDGSAELVLSAP